MQRFRLAYNNVTDSRQTAKQEHVTPVDTRILAYQLCVRQLMVVGIYVTKLHLIVADLGNARLDGQHGLHFFLGRCLVAARHDEQLLQIILVGSKHALVLFVVR